MTIFLQKSLMGEKKKVKVDNISVSLKQKILEPNFMRQGGLYIYFCVNKLSFIPPDFGH